jgi:Flp pilus assembly protein TadD
MNEKSPSLRWYPIIMVALALATTAAYWHLFSNDFTNFDDDTYILDNLWVQKGLNLDSIRWAFSFQFKHGTYWQPLTWLSLMLDYDLFGLNPVGYHAENLLLHTANALILFATLNRMTGKLWRPALVAALFALHPLNVESVAWAVERKNVLSSLFWMLCLWSYSRYVEKPSWNRYLPVGIFMAVGLMAKSMLVSLPCALLLLDFWPLGRMSLPNDEPSGGKVPLWRLILEKMPLLLLSLLSVAISVLSLQADSQHHDRTYLPPLPLRISEALVSYVKYIEKFFWPAKLAVYYPPQPSYPAWQVAGAGALLAGITILAILNYRKRPWLLTGWLWFLGVLFPVCGLMRAGLWPALADRFAYLPFIGLFMMVAWSLPDPGRLGRRGTFILAGVALVVIAPLSVLTFYQAGLWKTEKTLFSHEFAVAQDNFVARDNYGQGLLNQGRTEEAIEQYLIALRFRPNYSHAHFNMGCALGLQGKVDEAMAEYAEALRLDPGNSAASNNLGLLLADKQRYREAKETLLPVLKTKPNDPALYFNLGLICTALEELEQARGHFSEAIRLKPDLTKAHANLGSVLGRLERYEEASGQFEEVLKEAPGDLEARRNLAFTRRKLAEKKRL